MSIIQNSFIILINSPFDLNNIVRAHGFKFIYDYKVWYKVASKETLGHWEKAIDNDAVTVCHVESLNDIPKMIELHREAIKLQKECSPKEIEASYAPIASIYKDKVLEVSKWYATTVAKDHNVEVVFRNFKVLEVYRETAKAILVDIEFYAGISISCGICGAPLSNEISKATGIGPICASKMGLPRVSKVNAKEIVGALNRKCAQLGVFNNVWVAKSQIKRVVDSNRNIVEI